MDDVSFCICRRFIDPSWSCGTITFPDSEDPDGSEELLRLLDGTPEAYCDFANDYFESTVPLNAVRHVYDHAALTTECVAALNCETTLEALADELAKIGYPHEYI